ncbi:MAG TPA: hypothetical protein DCR40_11440 [Prolixibacteraceae bacterium]|nr:hypothetical protein [Prolixibacteraceae bacterium]
MNRLIFIIFLVQIHFLSLSQPIEGSTGLLKIPSAEMQTDGTFIAGANYLPNAITPDPFNYNTGNYYFNITFLPFMEFTYRSTLLYFEGNHNQDRSFGLRLRLLKESNFLPSIVAGGNDLYNSSQGNDLFNSSQKGRFFNTLYVTSTKHLALNNNQLGFTLGFGTGGVRKTNLNGVFGGISFVPAFLPSMRLIAEYDAKAICAGAEILFGKHLHLFGMAYDLKYFAGGLAYRIYLKN